MKNYLQARAKKVAQKLDTLKENTLTYKSYESELENINLWINDLKSAFDTVDNLLWFVNKNLTKRQIKDLTQVYEILKNLLEA